MHSIKVLGLSGKKQSGKNTAANYILGIWLKSLGIIAEFKITDKGNLWITDIFGNEQYQGIFDIGKDSIAMQNFAQEHIYPFIKMYSFADLLKKSICIDIFGLTYEQCYGTDEQKNSNTHLYWENMPGVITKLPERNIEPEKISGRLGLFYIRQDGIIYHLPGVMTAREVMQFAGTEIFRKMYNNVWVDATIRQIQKDNPIMAIVTDVRFPNEVQGIMEALEPIEGKVIRLTRDIFKGEDQHASETALDDYSKYSAIIDNHEMNIAEQNQEVYNVMSDIQWIPHQVPQELLERLPAE